MKLLVRCDATVGMGTGHAMRCLALAEGWQAGGGQTVFGMAEVTPAVEERLRQGGAEVVRLATTAGTDADAVQTAELASLTGAQWIVVDGYQFGAQYQRLIKQAGKKLLFVDDNGHEEHYFADLVLNQKVPVEKAIVQAFDLTPATLEEAVKKYFQSLPNLGIALDRSKEPLDQADVAQPYHLPAPFDEDEIGMAVTPLADATARALIGDKANASSAMETLCTILQMRPKNPTSDAPSGSC